MSFWKSKGKIFGLLLCGGLAAGIFVQAWGVMTAVSLPAFLEPVRAAHPRTIVWWIYLLYVGTTILTLIPAAFFWLAFDGSRRAASALLAVAPLIALLVADFTYSTLTFDLAPRYGRLLWDALLMLLGASMLFVTSDVLRRLTRRCSGPFNADVWQQE